MIKERTVFFLLSILLLLSCNFLQAPFSPATVTPVAGVPATGAPVTQPPIAPAKITDIKPILEKMGGKPCDENKDFTCVTIAVPLNHFDKSNTETINVAFAVLPASGERYGMFLQAFPGGPGGSGISTAFVGFHSPKIEEHYDIVFFDQRGIGLSNPLSCPKAYASDFISYLSRVDKAGLEGYDTPPEQQAAIDDARNFDKQCVAEIGIDPAKLIYFGTNQVAEDIDSFRAAIGDEKIWMYGVSYGTAVAQTYAAAHADRLAGLILDGTINMTLTGDQGSFSQEKAFDKVLVATLNACKDDQACATEMGGDALKIYDDLAEKISKTPIDYEFPSPNGEKVKRTFTFNELEFTAAYQMYSLSGRMLFLRALSAAHQGDMVPLARLLYTQAYIDPATFTYLGDPTFSDTMFYSVLCTDNSFYAGTPDQKVAQVIAAGQASNGTIPRLDGSIYTGLDCAFWPSAPANEVKTPPLKAPGVPTFVLDATLDPATPFEEGKAVFQNLDNGYLLYVEGGRHSIYGYGQECPDQYVVDFMVSGKLPSQRETKCDWGANSVVSAYVPKFPGDVSAFANPLDLFDALNNELTLLPEYRYSYLLKDESMACYYGGSFTFGPGDAGASSGSKFKFDKCEFTKGFAMTGTGGSDFSTGATTFDVDVTGAKDGKLSYTFDGATGKSSVTGNYGGQTVDLKSK